MTKLLIYVAIWKRPEVTEMCFKSLKNLISQRQDYSIDVFCVVSEKWAEALCKKYGFKYTKTKNTPLSDKKNFGLKAASKNDFDYIMEIGSDDCLEKSLFDFYKPYFDKKEPYFGINEYYLISPKQKKAKVWKYDVNHPIGAGRCIRKDVLKQLDFKIWPEGMQRGLDTNSDVNLIKIGYRCEILDTNKFPFVIDIKTDENLWGFDQINGTAVDYDFVTAYLPEVCEESLQLLEN